MGARLSLSTDIDAESQHNVASTSEVHDIGFENLRPESQGNPSHEIGNVVNVDATALRVERRYRRINKVAVLQTRLSIKKSQPL